MMRMILYIFILFISVSCYKSEHDFERSKLMINNQQFEILTAYEIYDSFIKNKSSYSLTVFNPIKNEFKNNAEYTFLFESIKREIKPDYKIKEELELLKDIDFEGIVDDTFRTVTESLSGPSTKILFIPTNPEHREFFKKFGMGIHAITVGKGKIIVSIDPTFDNWPQLIPYVLAHEYHHSVWTSRNFTTAEFTLLEYLILEGKADSFAGELYPNTSIPWFDMLTKDEEKRIWNLVKPELNKKNSRMNEIIMIGNDQIPYASGYAIGHSIMKAFKANNPHINDIDLIDITPEQILLLSKYDEFVSSQDSTYSDR